MRQPGTTARLLHAMERRAFAVALRQRGASYQAICDAARRHFGPALPHSYSRREAHRDVAHSMQALQRETDENARLVRDLELARLDELQLAAWPRAMQGDLDAITAVLKVMERRAKLLHLDGPVRIAQTTPDGQPEAGTSTGMTDDEFAAVLVLHPSRHPAGRAPSEP
jgi:hypothetical protein